MKTILFLLLLIFVTHGNAAGKSYFVYGNAHSMGGYLMPGLGIRTQKGIHNFDCSVNACPLNPPSSFKIFHVRARYLIYPRQTGFYFGGGLGILNEPETVGVDGSFEGAVGFQWKNKIFLEVSAIAPWDQARTIVPVFPGITLGFGF